MERPRYKGRSNNFRTTVQRKYFRIDNEQYNSLLARSFIYPRIVINVSGEIYETREITLQRFPNTLLGNPEKRAKYYCPISQQYFFDRSRMFFDAILFYYQSEGILRRPYGVPYDLFAEECRFYELPENVLFDCNPTHFDNLAQNTKMRNPLPSEETDKLNNNPSIKSRLWDLLENPKTSTAAGYFSSVSLLAVVLSVLSSCLQSMPSMQAVTQILPHNPWSIGELVLNTFFLLELILKVFSTPELKTFLSSKMTWIDALAVIPYFIVLMISSCLNADHHTSYQVRIDLEVRKNDGIMKTSPLAPPYHACNEKCSNARVCTAL